MPLIVKNLLKQTFHQIALIHINAHRKNAGKIVFSNINFDDWKERVNQKVL